MPSPQQHHAKLEDSYEPKSAFDVVVTLYKEPLASIKTIMSGINQFPAISERHPRLWIYVKDQKANIESIKNQTSAYKVIKLPNAGRENLSYLQHITTNWDDLARQTIFIQAQIHFHNGLMKRLHYYFTQKSGMISFGQSGFICDCHRCGDRDC